MQIYPAIDIINGQCVRLSQGDFSKQTVFAQDPASVAKGFQDDGATFLHIVDLDGARGQSKTNKECLKKILQTIQIPVQVGGGIRTMQDIEEKIEMGVSRVILGTAAIENIELVKTAVEKFGEKIAVGVDAKDGFVAVHGWEKTSNKKAEDLCVELVKVGVKTIIFTDISKDGMMQGCNREYTKKIVELTGINIIASGGVSTMQDLLCVQQYGAQGAIIGKAIYQKALELKSVLKKCQEKRIIPCLDIANARVVKGVNFVDIKDAGDPIETAVAYQKAGADELVFLDICATDQNRKTTIDLVEKTVSAISIPLTVGGGISSLSDAKKLFDVGVAKVSINSAAVKNPSIINEISSKFGSEKLVVAIDTKKVDGVYKVMIGAGKICVDMLVEDWAKEVCERGAGEILLTSMDCDGTKNGYDIELTQLVSSCVCVPVVASGGAGKIEDFALALTKGGASGALAASLFHFKQIEISQVKKYLVDQKII